MTVTEMRDLLADELKKIKKNGNAESRANADCIANLSGKILKSVVTEIQYAEHKSKDRKQIKFMESK